MMTLPGCNMTQDLGGKRQLTQTSHGQQSTHRCGQHASQMLGRDQGVGIVRKWVMKHASQRPHRDPQAPIGINRMQQVGQFAKNLTTPGVMCRRAISSIYV